MKDQRITLENFTFNTLGGEMGVTGFYETTTPAKPTFDVGLRMQKLDIPSAFQAFNTVRLLAPVAEYAKGNFSAELKLNGPLGKDMMPLYQALSGQGSLQTSKLLIQDFPALDKMASATKLNFLNDPTLQALRSQFAIRDGRLHLQPFNVSVGGTTMSVAGSNGLDQSLEYNLGLRVPRSLMGADANQAISGLLSKATGAGVDLGSAAEIPLGIQVGGTIKNPTIKTDLASLPTSVAKGATDAVKQAAEQQVNAQAQKLIADAETAGRRDPGGGPDAGGQGEAGRVPAGRLAGGEEQGRPGAHRGHRRRRPAAQGDATTGRPDRPRGGPAGQRARGGGEEAGGGAGHRRPRQSSGLSRGRCRLLFTYT